MSRSRRWCFTLNNPTDAEKKDIDTRLQAACKGYVYQLERGDEKTPHYQGYIVLKNPKGLGGVKALLLRAHWEKAVTHVAAIKYCSKEEGRLEDPVFWPDHDTLVGLVEQGMGPRDDTGADVVYADELGEALPLRRCLTYEELVNFTP